MFRKDREITTENEIVAIVKKCEVANIAFNDGEYPYVIPMNYGYCNENGKHVLYFHCSKRGKKLELIKNNGKVGFSMYCNTRLIIAEVACKSTMKFESVCGVGTLKVVAGEEKKLGLKKIMEQYSENAYEITDVMANVIEIIKMEDIVWTAKSTDKPKA